MYKTNYFVVTKHLFCKQTNTRFVDMCPCSACIRQHGLLSTSSLGHSEASQAALTLLYMGLGQNPLDSLQWVSLSLISLYSSSSNFLYLNFAEHCSVNYLQASNFVSLPNLGATLAPSLKDPGDLRLSPWPQPGPIMLCDCLDWNSWLAQRLVFEQVCEPW